MEVLVLVMTITEIQSEDHKNVTPVENDAGKLNSSLGENLDTTDSVQSGVK